MLSDIVQRFDVPLNPLYKEREALRSRGRRILDLISGNPQRAGFYFPRHVLKQALSTGLQRASTYAPHPLGQPAARKAVVQFYQREAHAVSEDAVVMTPGTSVSYWYLLKLLANPGDEILSPTPSYPLLDTIAELCGVNVKRYRLLENERWQIDTEHLRTSVTPRTRAIVLISPHNPTGAVAAPEELDAISAIARRHQLPVIVDEVFSAFLFFQDRLPRAWAAKVPLLFTLNGLSKMFALPGIKIGWIAVTGEDRLVCKAVQGLDVISDTFLPVNEAAQFALPVLFEKGKRFQTQFRSGVRRRMEKAVDIFRRSRNVSMIAPEGGFYVTLGLPEGKDEEQSALHLLRDKKILVHPGYFYDLRGSHLVVSFLGAEKGLTQVASSC